MTTSVRPHTHHSLSSVRCVERGLTSATPSCLLVGMDTIWYLLATHHSFFHTLHFIYVHSYAQPSPLTLEGVCRRRYVAALLSLLARGSYCCFIEIFNLCVSLPPWMKVIVLSLLENTWGWIYLLFNLVFEIFRAHTSRSEKDWRRSFVSLLYCHSHNAGLVEQWVKHFNTPFAVIKSLQYV